MSSTRTHNSFFFLGAEAAVVALVSAMAALLLLAYNANPAKAAGDCSTTSGTTTCTYVSTGAEDTFVVPAGVSSVHVFAVGAPGAAGDFYPINGASPAPGGAGARVSGNLTGLTPGDTLYVNVGGAPTGGDDCAAGINCNGGFNGGGTSGGGNLIASTGGGGGGASADCQNDNACADFWSGAGGGGGGSSLVPTTGGEGPLITGLSPSIVISYQGGGVGEPPPTGPQTKEECKKGGWKEFGFKNQGQCIKAVNHPS